MLVRTLTCHIYLCAGSVYLRLTVFIVHSRRKLWHSLYGKLKNVTERKNEFVFLVLSMWGLIVGLNFMKSKVHGRSTV